ncbi:hypothetical protein Goshw_004030 [Gossypium schwendimanii]|uniref:Uncharacterized protein n=1 Tax=Gossypium schwendimanii TaxID=34291 RepID=A0A7J9L7P5_GOSSC|nr:hypothetical protein [Gossypium schwendimanii]
MTGRKVLLIVDNCPAHLKNIDVKSTTCKLFPTLQNSTRGGYASQTRNW